MGSRNVVPYNTGVDLVVPSLCTARQCHGSLKFHRRLLRAFDRPPFHTMFPTRSSAREITLHARSRLTGSQKKPPSATNTPAQSRARAPVLPLRGSRSHQRPSRCGGYANFMLFAQLCIIDPPQWGRATYRIACLRCLLVCLFEGCQSRISTEACVLGRCVQASMRH